MQCAVTLTSRGKQGGYGSNQTVGYERGDKTTPSLPPGLSISPKVSIPLEIPLAGPGPLETEAADAPIDATTLLPGRVPVTGPAQLRRALLRRPDQFVQALTEKLMMYALGRELEYHDMPQVRSIVRAAARDDYRFSAIVTGIVSSDAFGMQALGE